MSAPVSGERPSPVSIRHLAALALASAAAPLVASAQPAADFPTAIDIPTLAAWLPYNTDLALPQVVSIGGGRVIAIVDGRPSAASPDLGTITIRTELVDRTQAAQAKALSETQDIEIDCANVRAKAGPMRQYAGRNLTGAMKTQPGWASWASAPPSTTLGRMIEAACNPNFRGVFVAAGLAAQPPGKPGPVAAPKVAAAPAAPQAALKLPRVATAPETELPAARASRAAPKPAAVAEAPAPEPTAAPAPPAPAADGGLGRHLVQISASRKRPEAEGTLAAYRKKYPDRMSGRPAAVEETTVLDQTFYRVLIGGFASSADANAFCDLHKTTGGDCLTRER